MKLESEMGYHDLTKPIPSGSVVLDVRDCPGRTHLGAFKVQDVLRITYLPPRKWHHRLLGIQPSREWTYRHG